ncbi:uncharacterized protein LOC127250379 isoform X2 [Andrographis paniculata]|uniref:uncharacterized protein LOC127250379 isoform X2 n=1 Tax=Andrographis paniculata TaxID=175694 RepID=UPI0021E71757|nr:uncharacterized protein LOC127250379 isoform X2 [Andrographis paniculata]
MKLINSASIYLLHITGLLVINDMLVRMNMEEKDVNLELQLGSTSYNSGTGAIASAGSRVFMAFTAPIPLYELVWSPNNGLGLKHASSDQNPLLWNKEPSKSTPADVGKSVASKEMDNVDDAFGNKFTSTTPSRSCPGSVIGSSHELHDHLEKAGTSCAPLTTDDSIDCEKEGLCSSQNDQLANISDMGKSIAGSGDCKAGEFIRKGKENGNSQSELNSMSQSIMGLDDVDHQEPLAAKLSKVHVVSRKIQADKRISASEEKNKAKIIVPFPAIAAPLLKKQESAAENDLRCLTPNGVCSLGEMKLVTKKFSPVEDFYLKKGKGKALSHGSIYSRAFNDENDECESVESRNNGEQVLKGIKRCAYDLELIVGTKRMKKYHMTPGFASSAEPASSFASWVSNMVKGVAHGNKEESLSVALTLTCSDDVYRRNSDGDFLYHRRHDSQGLDMGFQAVFRSLYCARKDNDSTEGSCKSLADEKLLLEDIPRSSRFNNASDILACNGENGDAITSHSDAQLGSNNVSEKGNLHKSQWVSLYGKKIARKTDKRFISFPEVNLDDARGVIDAVPIDQRSSENELSIFRCKKWIQRFSANGKAPIDPKSSSVQRKKFESSEAMASIFARRLDALKHAKPSIRKKVPLYSIRCFFCGSSHYLSECPNVSEAEVENLLVKISSVHGVEESTCLCIRCFRSDHWAITCPWTPSIRHFRPDPKSSIFSRYTAFRLELHAGRELVSADRTTWDMDISSSGNILTSDKIRTSAVSDENKGNRNYPQCEPATLDLCRAIRNLRVSRRDILKCLNSNASLSRFNGFFLRLRLGKLESGPGERGYYVACITDRSVSTSKKSITVNAGGVRSSIESQYISNDDFLEDEITAWCCRMVKSGNKIPSLNELNSKFDARKSLGF